MYHSLSPDTSVSIGVSGWKHRNLGNSALNNLSKFAKRDGLDLEMHQVDLVHTHSGDHIDSVTAVELAPLVPPITVEKYDRKEDGSGG